MKIKKTNIALGSATKQLKKDITNDLLERIAISLEKISFNLECQSMATVCEHLKKGYFVEGKYHKGNCPECGLKVTKDK